MKMIIVIIKDHWRDALTAALTDGQYRVTGIASTGGFMRSGVATLLIGVDEAQVDAAIALIHRTVGSASHEKQGSLYVVPVSRFEQV
ncbi:MAG TPA: cyclic-di-AMP receptor [Anaerolineales bacterium]